MIVTREEIEQMHFINHGNGHNSHNSHGRYYFWKIPENRRLVLKNLSSSCMGPVSLIGKHDTNRDQLHTRYPGNACTSITDYAGIDNTAHMEEFLRSQVSLLVTLLVCVVISMTNDDEASA